MIAFSPSGNLNTFTAATSAPTGVQSTGSTQVATQQYKLSNTDAAVDCVVGWGATSDEAKANALVATLSPKCTWLMHGTVEVITASPGAYFSGVTGSSTAVVKVQAGYGN